MVEASIELDGTQQEPDYFVEARAWPRFWGRLFDVLLYVVVLSFLVGYFFPTILLISAFNGDSGTFLFGIVLLPFTLILDAIIVSLFGNSLGKWLVGVKVFSSLNEPLDFSTALQRNLQVYFKGLALGIPLVSLIVYSSNYSKLNSGEQTAWDKSLDTRVYDVGSNLMRTIAVATVYLTANIGMNAYDRIVTQQSKQTAASNYASEGSDVDPIELELKKAAAEIQPQQVDDITKLEGAEASGRILTYRYTISRRDASNEQLIKYLNDTMAPNVCKDNDIRSNMDDYAITYRYQYSLPNQSELLSVDVTSELCRQLPSE